MILPLLEQFRPLLRLQVQRLHLDARLRRRFDSSDLVQDAMTRAVRCADEFRGTTEGEAFAWLQQILRTVTFNAIERQEAKARDFRRDKAIDELISDSSARVASILAAATPTPDERLARCELLVRLAEGVERLPDDQRDVVNLRDLHGYRVAEIAAMLGKTEKAVAGLLLRGRAELRELATALGLQPP
jgi:RNA polymerase sigma-70 factor, ECF subfamily